MINLIEKQQFIRGNNGFSLFSFEYTQDNFLNFLRDVEPFLRDNENNLLSPLFNLGQINLSMIKSVKSAEIYSYLDGFSDGSDWGEDRKQFKQLLVEFKNCDSLFKKEIFILNKDLFERTDKVVKFEEYISYGYYILLIWNDSTNFYVCEFFND